MSHEVVFLPHILGQTWAEAVARALEIVALFAANPGSGAIGFEGRMLDAPHLKQAQALLARANTGTPVP